MQEQGGTAYSFFGGKPYSPAGKTGTAQAFYDGPLTNYRMAPVMNLSLVGYVHRQIIQKSRWRLWSRGLIQAEQIIAQT